MRRAVLVCLSAAVMLGATSFPAARAGDKKKKQNETVLAGLRPGRDRLKTALNLHGTFHQPRAAAAEHSVVWIDTFKNRLLRVQLDEKETILSVTVSAIDPLIQPSARPSAPLPSTVLVTGRGLRILHSYCPDARETYGEPDSAEEVRVHGWSAEVLTYTFEKPPQKWVVSCERGGGKILEMQLVVTQP